MLPCSRYTRWFIICILFRMFHGNINTSFTLGKEIEEDFRSELDRPVPVESVNVVLNQRAELPCDISIKDKNDGVSMVLWFRDSDGEPLYSFDLRNKNSLNAKPWSSLAVLKNRATFVTKGQPALLLIDSITMEDENVYRCRVDFQNSPTRNSKVNLTVIEPPALPVIFDDKKRDRSKVSEPFNEGSEITLYCEVTGGKPTPRIDWYLEEKLMYGESEIRSSRVTIKRLTIPSLSRDYQNKKLSCHASNTNLALPAITYIILDINLKPLSMNITTKESYLSAGKLYNLECRCWGSKPPAHITWWIGSRQVNRETKTSLTEANMNDISIMSFTPSAEDDGKYLTCRAENPSMENSALEDKWHLNVQYSPILFLKIGPSLNPENIKEGDDVYFECYIRSNPKVHKFDWFHNGAEITSNISNHVIKSDHNLILQTIKKSASGNFTCYGANVEGLARSNAVMLNVKYSPICKIRIDEVYGASKQEVISLKCDVDANPPPIEFLWTFNNSGDLKSIHESHFLFTSDKPYLQYTPKTDSEFGILSCRAKNIIGVQEIACFFQIVAAGHPHPLLNCTISNVTDEDLQVICIENFDGGLPQTFLMEVWNSNEIHPTFNITVSQGPPIFNFHQIDTSLEYEFRLYAINQKGRSDAIILRKPLKGVAMYTSPLINFSFSSLTIILFLLGTCSTILIFVASIIICRRRKKADSNLKNENHNDILCHGAMLISEDTTATNHFERRSSSDDDPDPDLIPNIRERKELKTFSKLQKTPPMRRNKKVSTNISAIEDENRIDTKIYRNHYHLDRDSLPINRLLSGNARGTTVYPAETVVLKPAHNHKIGPEVVTASHRLQESCI